MKHRKMYAWAVLLLLAIPLIYSSCKKDEEAEVIASFTYQADASNWKLIKFTNTSTNYETVSWNFGDGNTSTEVNPEHTFAAAGEYTVTLTATSGGKNDIFATKINLSDPNVMLTALAGDNTKTWKLLRDVSGGVYPLEVGPWDRSTIWWAMGRGNDELANRPCMLNDEFTFGRDGSLVIDRKGDYWAEGGIYSPDNVCAGTDAMVGAHGENLSVWGGGTHTFVLDPANKKITVNGTGAFIGFEKLGNGAEVSNGTSATNPITPPSSITYSIVSLYDGDVDTLIVEGQYKWDAGDGGYWRFALVQYDDPNAEPPIPGNKPNVSFTYDISGLTVTFNNATTGATSHSWDFGDGMTSTEMSPVHTYAAGGPYTVSYSATNTNGTSTGSAAIFVTNDVLTDAMLQGGAWKIRVAPLSIFVGGGMGLSNWWATPVEFLNGGQAGTTDDWSCMTDDEFIFSAGGVYEFKTMGGTRNDGWWTEYSNGCITDAQIASSANNGPAFGSGIHSYTFTPASGSNRAIIELTNGASGAAFIGFMKGYFGGENTNSANPPNGGSAVNKYEVMGYANAGTKEYLFVTVDISAAHDGSASWSTILER